MRFMAYCISPIYLRKQNNFVPCGKCGNCVYRKISDYTLRLKVEWRHSRRCYFVTLTYAKNPFNIDKEDVQRYFKRLRKLGFSFSYFALGDYGDTFGRPHYHVVFFAKGIFDVSLLWDTWESGRVGGGRGFVDIRPVTFGRLAYVVSYGFLAKVSWQKEDKRTPPFFLMSKRPALGSQYLTRSMIKYHRLNDLWYFPDHGFKKALPRFFRDKIFSKLSRDVHSVQFALKSDEKLMRDLFEISLTQPNPDKVYAERMIVNSDLYLGKLIERKKSKNKLL